MSWFWLALSAAILWGLGYTLNQMTLRYFTAVELILFESLIIGISFSLYITIKGDWLALMTKLTNFRYCSLLLASSFIYILASYLILKSIHVSNNAALAAIIESCYPVFTVIFTFLFFGSNPLNLSSGIGFLLIFAGITIIQLSNH